MDFFEVIKRRYSYRGEFATGKIAEEDIKKIINAGLAAPCGKKKYTTSYIAVTSKSFIEILGKIMPMSVIRTAPFVLIILSEDISGGYDTNFEIENYAAATENILLAVSAIGLATVWTDGILRMPTINDAIRKLFNIPSNKSIRAVLPIGKAKFPTEPQNKVKLEDLVVFK